MKEFDYYIFIDFSENLIGYNIIRSENVKGLLSKTNKFRQESEGQANIDEIYKKIISRLESEKKRYWDLYKIDHTNKNNFDLIIDTNKNNLNQVVDIVVKEYKNWINN